MHLRLCFVSIVAPLTRFKCYIGCRHTEDYGQRNLFTSSDGAVREFSGLSQQVTDESPHFHIHIQERGCRLTTGEQLYRDDNSS